MGKLQMRTVVPELVDLDGTVLLAVSDGDTCAGRFVRNRQGQVIGPAGVYGLAYFSREELCAWIREWKAADDPLTVSTGQSLEQRLAQAPSLDALAKSGRELVFCLTYQQGNSAAFTLLPVKDIQHLVELEQDAILHGDSYYCFVRKCGDTSSFAVKDIRSYRVMHQDGRYLLRLVEGHAKWVRSAGRAGTFSRAKAKGLVRILNHAGQRSHLIEIAKGQ